MIFFYLLGIILIGWVWILLLFSKFCIVVNVWVLNFLFFGVVFCLYLFFKFILILKMLRIIIYDGLIVRVCVCVIVFLNGLREI